MKQIPVIIDCDPGADDSLGILLALHSKKISVLGITTVCGNAPSMQTALNATKILGLAGREDVSVYCGADQPMKRNLEFSTLYSGLDGLCDTGLEERRGLLSELGAKEYFIETLNNVQSPVTVVATAGFTNLAEALQEEPGIAGGIKEIVAASGYFGLNQKECRAEWNILVDPEAAKIIFSSGIPVRAIGLDVTCMLEDACIERILSCGTGRIIDFFSGCDAYNRKAGLSPCSLLVDGMAMAAVISPEIACYETGKVIVHPERTDEGLMEFHVGEGNVKAAYKFDMEFYLKMIEGMITG